MWCKKNKHKYVKMHVGKKHHKPLPCECQQNIFFSCKGGTGEAFQTKKERNLALIDWYVRRHSFEMMIRDQMCMGWSITDNCSCPGHVMLHDLHHNANSNPGLRDKRYFLSTLTEHEQCKILYQGVAVSQSKVKRRVFGGKKNINIEKVSNLSKTNTHTAETRDSK